MSLAMRMSDLESIVNHAIRAVGLSIDVLGVAVIVGGLTIATYLFLHRRASEQRYDAYRVRIGRTLLLGLEVLVAADIVKTIAFDLTPQGLGVLAGLILVRTFLSWGLVVEVEGRWPWQREPSRLAEVAPARVALIDGRAARHDAGKASA